MTEGCIGYISLRTKVEHAKRCLKIPKGQSESVYRRRTEQPKEKVQKDKQRFSCDRLIDILFIAERPAISISVKFRTRTGSIIYIKKLYRIEGKDGSTIFDCHCKNIESCVGTKILDFCRGCNVPTLFQILHVTNYGPRSGFYIL